MSRLQMRARFRRQAEAWRSLGNLQRYAEMFLGAQNYNCVGTTKDGGRCSRAPMADSDYCARHLHQKDQPPSSAIVAIRFPLVRMTLPAEDTLPVPVSEVEDIDDSDTRHVLSSEVDIRAGAMWRWAPWAVRERSSRRYEGFR